MIAISPPVARTTWIPVPPAPVHRSGREAAWHPSRSGATSASTELHREWHDDASRVVMARMLELSQLLMSEVALERVYETVLRVAEEATGAERVSLQVLDETAERLVLAAAYGLPPSVELGQTSPRERGLAGWVLERLEPLLAIGATHPDPSVQRLLRQTDDDRSALCVPLLAHGQPVGVLNATRFDARRPFGRDDLELLEMLAGPVALAIAHGRLHDHAERLASHDALTGLLNHRAFQERCEAEMDRSARGLGELSLLVLDLDRFKKVNEEHGHAAGDRLLRLVAQDAIEASVRPYDIAGRLGGDEFAVLLPHTSPEQAALVAERICQAVAGLDYAAHDLPAGAVTASIGIAHHPTDAMLLDDLREMAEKGLFYAKYLGRNQCQRGSSSKVASESDPEKLQQLLEGSNHAVIEALAAAVDARDAYTAGHSRRVAEYAVTLARLHGHDDAFCQHVRIAALFHDVGKIGVPDAVLLKPGRLSDEEFAEIQRHPTIGADQMLSKVPFLHEHLPAIRHHHERWDGRGYPNRLEGEEIPYVARILALADAYDAMTSTRVYRKALSTDDVLRIFEEGAGTQWDPTLAATWLEYVRSRPAEDASPVEAEALAAV